MPEELDFLRKLLPELPSPPDVTVGAGDDCAAVTGTPGMETLLAVDQLIEKVHYFSDTPPRLAGAKLMNRNLSDIAAMGGTPRWALLTLADCGHDLDWKLEFSRGVVEAGKRHRVALVGGDTASLPAPGSVATLTIAGEVERGTAVTRSGANPGDLLYVTGKIGGSLASGRHLTFTPRLAEGAFLRGRVSAMLDISDGLLLDAGRLAAASLVDLEIDPGAVPLHDGTRLPDALSDGEDYELLFTASYPLENIWPAALTPIHRIGRVVAGTGRVLNYAHQPFNMDKTGYEH